MVKIKVNDISCEHCRTAITKQLKDVEGISGLEVSVESREVSFSGKANVKKVKRLIREAGYTPE